MFVNSRKLSMIIILLLVLLAIPAVVQAQDEIPGEGDIAEWLPPSWFTEWFGNLAIAGLALSPVTTAVVQMIKVVGSQIGIVKDGWGGYITLLVSVGMVLLALGANLFQVEAEVAEALGVAQRVAEAMLTLLAALGWYSVGKRTQIIKPMRWSDDGTLPGEGIPPGV